MKNLLIPSRHIIHSKEQVNYLKDLLSSNDYENIIFAITSYNLNNCKYSPTDLVTRVNFIDSLIFELKKDYSFKFKIVCIPHYGKTNNYVDKIIKQVNSDLSLPGLNFAPMSSENTEVVVFGEKLCGEFVNAGYVTHYRKAVDHVDLFKKLYHDNDLEYFNSNISDSAHSILRDREDILYTVKNIWEDKILKETGSLTDHRDYNSYAYDMSNASIIKVKYNDIKDYIVEGKILDDGCADAMIFAPISIDYPDSDLIGVDISNDFIARAEENIRRGIYGGSFVNIIQANLLLNNFSDESINTVICNSTMHEIWSYNNKQKSVDDYLKIKYKQLKDGGRVIIRDVIGPENKSKIVYFRSLEDDNSCFKKFIEEFKHINSSDVYERVTLKDKEYFKVNMKLLSEYLLHKDYKINWNSEMNEEFCHFNLDDWSRVASYNGFKLVEAKSYLSDWIYTNRYKDRLEILEINTLLPIDAYPHTNAVIVMEK